MEFDLEHWKNLLLPNGLPVDYETETRCVSGPNHFVAEYLLRERQLERSTWLKVPAEFFIMGIGEPHDPSCTKSGGLPFRSASQPWPEIHNTPYTFIAQFNFNQSSIVDNTPGDILLVFALDPGDIGQQDQMHLEWQSSNQTSLIKANQIPKCSFEFEPVYGVKICSHDYLPPQNVMNCEGAIRCTKIGGIPATRGFCFGPDEMGSPLRIETDYDKFKPPGEFLCSLCSVNPSCVDEYDFTNHKEPYDGHGLCAFADAGQVHFFLNSDGSVLYDNAD